MGKRKLIDAGDLTMCLNDWAVSVKVEKYDDNELKYTERDLMLMKYRTIIDCMGMVDNQQEADAVPADAVASMMNEILERLSATNERYDAVLKR